MLTLLKQIRSHWRHRFFRWLDRRSPKTNHHKLTTKNLYIFPNRRGFIFLSFVLVLWLLGTNYQNNLILALTFLLISIFVVSILHTFANLSGMEIELKGAANAFAGDTAEFFFAVRNTNRRPRDGISLQWQDSALDATEIAVEKHASIKAIVSLPATKRGVLTPKRLLVESVFPLGLLRCWTWLNFDAHALVYPRPMELPLNSSSVVDDEGDGEHPVKGGEDFDSLHEYRPGDPLKHIAWKLFARERGLLTKEFSQNLSREIWLDFFHVNAPDTEDKLSALCFWALQFHLQDENYGLLMPGIKVTPNKGENHKANILEMLARFDGNS